MSDIEIAVRELNGHSICLCRDGAFFTDDGRGISPMMKLIAQGKDLTGYSAADVIVGKAAAMLFVKAGIVSVYAKTLSQSGMEYLKANGIPCGYDTLTERIIDRSGNDICPMEKAVSGITDPEEAYSALSQALTRIRKC